MSSTITNYSNSINVNYPVPGVDNDTQGFRSNFNKIQASLSIASNEITELQSNSVTLLSTNDFGDNVIQRAALQDCSILTNDVGSVSGVIEVDYALGSYQIFQVNGGTHTFNVTNWPPEGNCGTVRLEITPSTTTDVTINLSGVNEVLSRTSYPVVYNTTSTIVWDVWSPDNGVTVIASEIGSDALKISGTGNIYSKAGSTAMTNGFFYIPSAGGAPSGVPTSISGHVPMYYDTSNNHFYVYNGAWKKVTLS